MTDSKNQPGSHPSAAEHPTTATYRKVFLALLVFTVLEYAYAMWSQADFPRLVLGLSALAVAKASLVAMFFMHLKFEGRWVYLLLAPAGFLVAALLLALYPDLGLHPSDAPSYVGEWAFAPFLGSR